MIAIFTANTRNKKWLIFNTSYWIKLFTWLYIRPEVRRFFGLKDIHDCPTHSWNIGEKTESGRVIIFEANKTMGLNTSYEPSRKFAYKGNSVEIFWDVVGKEEGKVYAIWQWLNYVNRLFWHFLGRDTLHSKQLVGWLNVCSELCYIDMKKHTEIFYLPVMKKEIEGINRNVFAPADIYNVLYKVIMSKEAYEIVL